MSLKIDEIMDLSLDDYIAISKNSPNDNAVKNSNNNEKNTSICSNDGKFGRRKGNIDDEDEDEEDEFVIQDFKEEIEEDNNVGNGDTGIWKGPDSSISYLDFEDKHNDLREKLNSNNNVKTKKRSASVQYRLKAPNNSANRPRGIPTSLPVDAHSNKHNNNRNGFRRYKFNCGGFNNFQRHLNNGRKNFSVGSNGMGGVNNGRIQRNRKQDTDGNKNLRFSVTRDNGNIRLNNTKAVSRPAQNMVVETPSSYVNLKPSAPLNPCFQVPQSSSSSACTKNCSHSIPVGNLTPQAEAALNLNSGTNHNLTSDIATSTNNESLKSLLGFQGNVSGDMMPVFANRLMEFIHNGLKSQVHKPIYDMKVQKDIHEIQKKPLLYKCSGGEVVSSDGAGINCKIIPRTSGVSLNCRFA